MGIRLVLLVPESGVGLLIKAVPFSSLRTSSTYAINRTP